MKIFLFCFIHNAIVHPMMAFSYEPTWLIKLHDFTAKKGFKSIKE